MRIKRDNHCWRVIDSFSGVRGCLESLALKKGYRVAALCSALGCSNRHLYKVFMRDIGLPPKTWMNLECMVVARRKLEGGKTIQQVARELGFGSVATFNRRFHKMYRMSPGRFVSRRLVFDPENPVVPLDAEDT